MSALDLAAMLQPVKRHSVLSMETHYVWGGSMVRTDDGTCHLLFAMWPREEGFQAWVTHSQVGHATADCPTGPYAFQGMALEGSGDPNTFDRDVIHNPTAIRVGDEYFLYYTGNYGNGEYWDHRNHQRVGVVVADHPAGPWKRFDKCLLDVTRGSWDHLITTNPSVAAGPGGKFVLMYKTVGEGEMPFGGNVVHGVAIADDPLGPFIRHPEPVLTHPTAKFPLEDPIIWYGEDRYYCLIKDQGGHFTGVEGMTLCLFASPDAIDWQLSENPLVSRLEINWEDGEVQPVKNLERPQVTVENGIPQALFCACNPAEEGTLSFNVQVGVG